MGLVTLLRMKLFVQVRSDTSATGSSRLSGKRRGNSAQRLKQAHDAFVLGGGLAEAVAARLVRQAGADAVLLLALAMEA
jgi:hypothetical protein